MKEARSQTISALELHLIVEQPSALAGLNKMRVYFIGMVVGTLFLMVYLFTDYSLASISIFAAAFILSATLLKGLSRIRYSFAKDHKVVGQLILEETSITIKKDGNTKRTDLENTSLKLRYGYVRGTGQFRLHELDNGISELCVDNQRFKFIIYNYHESEHLSKVLDCWYRQAFHLEECTKDENEYRLLKLERDFDWKEWEQVKANNEKRAGTNTQSSQ